MVVDKKMIRLICDLEFKIGNHTYNPNSYDGWTGDEGCSYKYPVNYCATKEEKKSQKLKKSKDQIEVIPPECIETMKYTFGSNHLYIGDGIVDALEYIEKRYGIDFNKLEKKRIEKKKNDLLKMTEDIKNGESITITAGIKTVGIDLPIGSYIVKAIETKYYSCSGTFIVFDDDGHFLDILDFKATGDQIEFRENTIIKSLDDFILEKIESI